MKQLFVNEIRALGTGMSSPHWGREAAQTIMEHYGTLWNLMEPYGTLWNLMEHYGTLWEAAQTIMEPWSSLMARLAKRALLAIALCSLRSSD